MATQKRVTERFVSQRKEGREALDELLPLVYRELCAIAHRKLRQERRGHSLSTTALVHEAYLKLVKLNRVRWQSRAHFLAIAAQAMRRILVNHALSRKRLKRGGSARRVLLEEAAGLPAKEADRILALDLALEKLAAQNVRHARVVECRFFGGMTIEETAIALGVSSGTARRDWTLLRAWLRHELKGEA